MRAYLHEHEAMALLQADLLDDDELVTELLTLDQLAHRGYLDHDGLLQLAALSLTLARRQARRATLSTA